MASATAWSPADAPVCAIAAAALTTSSRFFGLTADSSTPRPAALGGVKVSMACIHFGSWAWSPPAGLPRHCLTAISSSASPSASFSQLTQLAGAPFSLAFAPLERSSTIDPTAASPTIHPMTNAGPFVRARDVPSISTTLTMGTGLSATPTPKDNTWPIASLITSTLDPFPLSDLLSHQPVASPPSPVSDDPRLAHVARALPRRRTRPEPRFRIRLGTSSDLTDSSAAQAARGFAAASSAPPRSAPRAPLVADGEARLEKQQPDEQGDQREDRAAEDPQQRRHHEHEQPKWRDQRQPDQYPGRDAMRVGVELGGLAFHRP